jgi:prolipoprotein diacylglyceryltransferase
LRYLFVPAVSPANRGENRARRVQFVGIAEDTFAAANLPRRSLLPPLFHPELHFIFEALAYPVAYAAYRHARARHGDFLSEDRRWAMIAAAAVGALAGSRLLGLLEQAPANGLAWHSLLFPGGKTIVGGLLGGWLVVELVKRAQGLRQRTGDLFAIPLCLGIAIGRFGCFLAGLADDTYGLPTRLPWGVNFGDGVPRHPTQLYEILFLIPLALLLNRYQSRPHPRGRTFRLFMAAYLSWRLLIDFLKPQPHVLGMNVIQWACVAGLCALALGEVLAPLESNDAES